NGLPQLSPFNATSYLSHYTVLRLRFQVQLPELLRIDRRRGSGHQVQRIGGLRKRDDVADRRFTGQDGHDAIDPERNPAVRRRAVLQRFEEEAESQLRLLVRDPQALEQTRLQP